MFAVLAAAAAYELRSESQAEGIGAAKRRDAEGRMLPGRKRTGRPRPSRPRCGVWSTRACHLREEDANRG
jgi:hypothetical protein